MVVTHKCRYVMEDPSKYVKDMRESPTERDGVYSKMVEQKGTKK